ncbi:MAG: hypothetical protein IJ079_08975 [Lachnospiraceae bacterium]|nr:hypothetical protein [Lachnospiraceae bacterium]
MAISGCKEYYEAEERSRDLLGFFFTSKQPVCFMNSRIHEETDQNLGGYQP